MLNQPIPQSNIAANGPAIVRNNLKALSSFNVGISTTAQGAETNLLVFAGPVPSWVVSKFSAVVPDQTDTVLTSSVSAGTSTGYTEYKNYLANVGMFISGIRMTVSDTSVYNGSLFIGEMPPNGIASPQEIKLTQYTTGLGGGIDKTLLINDVPFAVTGNLFLYISSVPASATISFEFLVGAVADSRTVNAVS